MLKLEDLGLTKEELQERVVEKIAEKLMTTNSVDDQERVYVRESELKLALDKKVEEGVETALAKLAKDHVEPGLHKYVENLVLQETNKWGEKKGATVTFTEYLVGRAEAYLYEPVDHNGLTEADQRAKGNSWYRSNPETTRVAFLIHKYLNSRISSAMNETLKTVDQQIAGGIAAAVETEIKKIGEKVRFAVTAKAD